MRKKLLYLIGVFFILVLVVTTVLMRNKASSTNHQKNVEDTFNEARIINANSFLGMDYLESSQRENTSEYSMGPFMTDLSLSSRTYDGFVEG